MPRDLGALTIPARSGPRIDVLVHTRPHVAGRYELPSGSNAGVRKAVYGVENHPAEGGSDVGAGMARGDVADYAELIMTHWYRGQGKGIGRPRFWFACEISALVRSSEGTQVNRRDGRAVKRRNGGHVCGTRQCVSYGIQRAEELLRANGNPPLEFDIDDRAFAVVVRRRNP